ncbi:hypothetical protein [Streptacidiphilus rugosus]|uniref:hypothetical protein n=1 Tax=Streptacidiphilus rugosus TaxID=405783 RepID=UPI00056A788A|nr:hypothetical protein [Streptacidiphilus rugosus]
MITAFLFNRLPGPAWVRLLLLLIIGGVLGLVLWGWFFPWLVLHFGSALQGNPTVGGTGN